MFRVTKDKDLIQHVPGAQNHTFLFIILYYSHRIFFVAYLVCVLSLQRRFSYLEEEEKKCGMAVGVSSAGLFGAWRARAAQFFFLLMLFSFPIFSVPCGNGTCSSPSDVVAFYGYTKGILSEEIAKGLMYPGAFLSRVEGIVADTEAFDWPAWDLIFEKFKFSKNEGATSPPVSLGFVIGCVLCLVGGACSMFGPSMFSLLGMIIVLYYIYVEGGENKEVSTMPMFALAVFCSFGWMDLDWLTRSTSKKPSGIIKKQQ